MQIEVPYHIRTYECSRWILQPAPIWHSFPITDKLAPIPIKILAAPVTPLNPDAYTKLGDGVLPLPVENDSQSEPFIVQAEGVTLLWVLNPPKPSRDLLVARVLEPRDYERLRNSISATQWNDSLFESIIQIGTASKSIGRVAEKNLPQAFVRHAELTGLAARKEATYPTEEFWGEAMRLGRRPMSDHEIADIIAVLSTARFPLVRPMVRLKDIAPLDVRNETEIRWMNGLLPQNLILYSNQHPDRVSELLNLVASDRAHVFDFRLLVDLASSAENSAVRSEALTKLCQLRSLYGQEAFYEKAQSLLDSGSELTMLELARRLLPDESDISHSALRAFCLRIARNITYAAAAADGLKSGRNEAVYLLVSFLANGHTDPEVKEVVDTLWAARDPSIMDARQTLVDGIGTPNHDRELQWIQRCLPEKDTFRN